MDGQIHVDIPVHMYLPGSQSAPTVAAEYPGAQALGAAPRGPGRADAARLGVGGGVPLFLGALAEAS